MRDFSITDDILDCEVRVFFPEKFKEMFLYSNDVHPAHILRSFADELTTEIIEKMREKEGTEDSMGGKSGELIISSLNRKFIIKTISKQEGQTFLDLIDAETENFMEHVCLKNRNTFMPKIFGYLEFSFVGLKKIMLYVIIMENLVPVSGDCILRKYDLKGSTIGRKVLSSKVRDSRPWKQLSSPSNSNPGSRSKLFSM
jgi:hypothetical protein